MYLKSNALAGVSTNARAQMRKRFTQERVYQPSGHGLVFIPEQLKTTRSIVNVFFVCFWFQKLVQHRLCFPFVLFVSDCTHFDFNHGEPVVGAPRIPPLLRHFLFHLSTNLLAYLRTRAPIHPRTNAPAHQAIRVPTHPLTYAPAYQPTRGPTHPHTNQPIHPFTYAHPSKLDFIDNIT